MVSIHKHDFTAEIIAILDSYSEGRGSDILTNSEIIQYLNIKTKAANRGSKSRASFANHYAIYVLIEDYLKGGFNTGNIYADYDGAKFSDLLLRQRELPFGSKLQNHALNHRLNQEFKKYFPACEHQPVIRDVENSRYWINEKLIKTELNAEVINLAPAIKKIIEAYVQAREKAFSEFLAYCQ